jgi:mono/diheme cytochrome c family protein
MSQPSRPAPSTPVVAAAAAVGALLVGFFMFKPGRPATELREWRADDHDQPAEVQGQPPPSRPKGGQAKGQDFSNVVELAWAKNCARCHGPLGRGDGPQAVVEKAPDLTRPELELSDEQVADVVRSGRKGMPAFAELPANVVQGLAQRIRANRRPR